VSSECANKIASPIIEKTKESTNDIKDKIKESSDHGYIKSAKGMLDVNLEKTEKAKNTVKDKYAES
jgi:hypothetical protein